MSPSKNREGAGKAGSLPPPWPPCSKKCTGQEPQVRPRHPGPPCANGFTAYTRSPQGPAFLPLSLTTLVESIANLTPAPGCQDHTTSPSASMPYVQRHQCVHRSP